MLSPTPRRKDFETMTTTIKTKPKGRPFKKFFCDRKEVFLLPPLALKLWLFYYQLEGAKREGWAPRQTICEQCRMDKDAVTFWRRWLVEHGWMQQVGLRKTPNNPLAAIPVMQVTRGTVPDTVERRGKSKLSKANLKRGRSSQSPHGSGNPSPRTVTESSVTPMTEISASTVTDFSGNAVTEISSHDVDKNYVDKRQLDKTYVDGPGEEGPVVSPGQPSLVQKGGKVFLRRSQ
jgi:hypothetical protein